MINYFKKKYKLTIVEYITGAFHIYNRGFHLVDIFSELYNRTFPQSYYSIFTLIHLL